MLLVRISRVERINQGIGINEYRHGRSHYPGLDSGYFSGRLEAEISGLHARIVHKCYRACMPSQQVAEIARDTGVFARGLDARPFERVFCHGDGDIFHVQLQQI